MVRYFKNEVFQENFLTFSRVKLIIYFFKLKKIIKPAFQNYRHPTIMVSVSLGENIIDKLLPVLSKVADAYSNTLIHSYIKNIFMKVP